MFDRALIHVEGETEETFVNEVLAPHLRNHGVSVAARLLGNARKRNRRGGIQRWQASRRDIIRHLRQDPSCCCTTFVDYYGLPKTGANRWPGRSEADSLEFSLKAETVESAVFADVSSEFEGNLSPERFIPFVVIHEFEGLLFSDCDRFAEGIGRVDLTPEFKRIRDQFGSPEEINDSQTTAPSKRIRRLVRGYQKPLYGTLAALEIGLDAIRGECPHLNEWLGKMEALSRHPEE